MSLERHRQDWERLAEADPLWAVLTDPSRRGHGWDADEFLATGAAEVGHVLETAASLGLPHRYGRALDFGCGVGRLTRALGGRFDLAVGVDISAAMVEAARRVNADVPACEFVVNTSPDLARFRSREFDLAYSSLVLQHQPSRELVGRYVGELLRVTAPDGLVVFGVPDAIAWPYRLELRRRLYAFLRTLGVSEAVLLRRTSLTPMRMTVVPERLVRTWLGAHGATLRQVEVVEEGSVRMLRYYVSPPSER